jgi:hypothetical protein
VEVTLRGRSLEGNRAQVEGRQGWSSRLARLQGAPLGRAELEHHVRVGGHLARISTA